MKNPKSKIQISKSRVAIVVEELTQLGGAERVLDAVLELFPKAPVYTLVWNKERTQHHYDKFDIRPSFIQKLPLAAKRYKWYLPLMPKAVESFDLSEFDLIISITSALVKGIRTNKNQLHICYCNTPTRYLWVDSAEYVRNAPIPFFIRPLMPLVLSYLKGWDLKASKRPDFFIGNSQNVKKRILKYYHRDSVVIYPMTDVNKFKPINKIGDYYLLVSRIEPYKRVDMVIEAFRGLDEKLKIIGSGTKKEKMALEAPRNVEFIGRLSDEKLSKMYAGAKAFIFPQEEDFGITPVEAMAAGRPVIAFRKGGALETVIEGKTGEFFSPQTVGALREAIVDFNYRKYKASDCIEQAKKFDKTLFKKQLLEYIKAKLIKQE